MGDNVLGADNQQERFSVWSLELTKCHPILGGILLVSQMGREVLTSHSDPDRIIEYHGKSHSVLMSLKRIELFSRSLSDGSDVAPYEGDLMEYGISK